MRAPFAHKSSGPSVLIVGAGLIGLSCADALSRRGAEVTVIEARSGPARGASFANGGMIHPSQARCWSPAHSGADQTSRDADRAVLDLALRSRDLIENRIDALGLSPSPRKGGCYQIFDTIDAARTAHAIYGEIGVGANIVIDPAASFDRPALFFPDDRSFDAHIYAAALAKDLKARGVLFIWEAADLRLRRSDDAVAAALGDHRFRTDHVIIAAGAQSGDLLSMFDLSLRVSPVRGHSLDFDRPDGLALPDIPVMDAASRSAYTPFQDRIRLSGTWGEDKPDALLARWAEIAPDMVRALGKPTQLWSGLRPVSAAGRPYIGATPIPGLWINTGHGHMGWTLSAGSGSLMAEMILDGAKDDRFSYSG